MTYTNWANQIVPEIMFRNKTESNDDRILKTYDYNMFKHMKGNREVNQGHVKKIIKSMKEKYMAHPILVNNNMEIIDGQHRFAAAKELELPVSYQIIKGGNIQDVQRLNTTSKKWGRADYLNMYCKENVSDYLIFQQFKDEYDFLDETYICLLTDTSSPSTAVNHDFKTGNFKVVNVALAIKRAEAMSGMKEYHQKYNSRAFTRALLRVFKIKGYDHKVFLGKLQYCAHMLQHSINTEACVENIEKIYNFNNKKQYVYFTKTK